MNEIPQSNSPLTDDAWRRYVSMEWNAEQAINVSRLLERKLGMLQHVNAQLCAVLAEAGAPQDPANAFEMAAWAKDAAAAKKRGDELLTELIAANSEIAELKELIIEARMYVEDAAKAYYDEDPSGSGARETLALMRKVKL